MMSVYRVLPAALLLSLAAAAAVAFAGVSASVPTTLKMRNRPPAFHGKVASTVPACKSERRVKLFRQSGGFANGRGFSRTLIGRTNSDRAGRWLISVDPLLPGGYIAKVKQHLVSVDGVLVRCEPDFSRGIVVD